MDEIIHFRTRYIHEKGIGSSSRYISGRSSDACEIRAALPYDDARDIVWSKSTGSSIYTRNRLVNSSINISLVIHESGFDRDKTKYIDTIADCIEKSCRFSGDTYTFFEVNGESYSKVLPGKKNSLIIILTSSVELEEYQKLSGAFSGNDVLFVMLFHPIELEPGRLGLFESHVPTEKYYREMKNRIRSIEKMLHSSSKSNIVLRTDDNIVLKLNNFFKYRYG